MLWEYWQKFAESGKIQDYLAYRNSLNNQNISGEINEQSDNKGNRDSNKGNQDTGK